MHKDPNRRRSRASSTTASSSHSATMSLKVKPNKQARSYASPRSFSSSSMGSFSLPRTSSATNQGAPISPVTINKNLLTPLNLDIDRSAPAACTEEKEQIKTLNNRFVSFIEKVRLLEQKNKMLETKWKLLQEQPAADTTIEQMLKSYIASLQNQLDLLGSDKQKLELENKVILDMVEDYRTKFEEEFNRRNEAENDFVMLKKDVDASCLSKINLEEMASSLSDEIMFLKTLYDEERRELQESIKDTSVVVEINNSRDLNMDPIIAYIKAQYEEIASQSRKEAESWYKNKFGQMTVEADQYSRELRSTKKEISELQRRIKKLQSEISTVKAQSNNVQLQVAEAEEFGDMAMLDAKKRINDLEAALHKAKQAMAHQIREYQDLMNVKLALDIEISTYKKLLEGEEERLGQESVLSVRRVPTKVPAVVQVDSSSQRKSGALVIKTVETKDISYS